MSTPLARILAKQGKTQREVAEGIEPRIDTGQFSRFVNGKELPNRTYAENISKYFRGAISELELLYPERYPDPELIQKAS